MAFGKNHAELVGRLGADVTVNHLTSGGRVANLSIATDESYIEKNSGNKVDKTEWHRIVTFQDGLIDMLQKHARKGRLVHIEGKLQTRRWRKDGEDSDRFSTEILIVPGGRVQFYDKPVWQRRAGGGCRSARGRRRSHAGRRRPVGIGRDSVLENPSPLPPRLGRHFGAGLFFCCGIRGGEQRLAGAPTDRSAS